MKELFKNLPKGLEKIETILHNTGSENLKFSTACFVIYRKIRNQSVDWVPLCFA